MFNSTKRVGVPQGQNAKNGPERRRDGRGRHENGPILLVFDPYETLRRTSGLSRIAYRVLLAIEARCGKHWWCFSSDADLAAIAGCSGRNVRNALADLEEAGWIRRLRRRETDRHRYIALIERNSAGSTVTPMDATWEAADAERRAGAPMEGNCRECTSEIEGAGALMEGNCRRMVVRDTILDDDEEDPFLREDGRASRLHEVEERAPAAHLEYEAKVYPGQIRVGIDQGDDHEHEVDEDEVGFWRRHVEDCAGGVGPVEVEWDAEAELLGLEEDGLLDDPEEVEDLDLRAGEGAVVGGALFSRGAAGVNPHVTGADAADPDQAHPLDRSMVFPQIPGATPPPAVTAPHQGHQETRHGAVEGRNVGSIQRVPAIAPRADRSPAGGGEGASEIEAADHVEGSEPDQLVATRARRVADERLREIERRHIVCDVCRTAILAAPLDEDELNVLLMVGAMERMPTAIASMLNEGRRRAAVDRLRADHVIEWRGSRLAIAPPSAWAPRRLRAGQREEIERILHVHVGSLEFCVPAWHPNRATDVGHHFHPAGEADPARDSRAA